MFLPRPARLGDFPEPVEDLVFPPTHRVEHVKSASLGEDQVSRIRTPDWVFARRENACAATAEIKHRNLEIAAANIEGHLLSIG